MKHPQAAIVMTAALIAGLISVESVQAQVEYVRVCDAYGTGFYFIPGTDTCVNASTGETRRETENGTEIGSTDLKERVDQTFDAIDELKEGVALGIAMAAPFVPDGKTFAVMGNFGTFEGENAFSVTGAAKLTDSLYLSGGVGGGLEEGSLGGRASVMFAW